MEFRSRHIVKQRPIWKKIGITGVVIFVLVATFYLGKQVGSGDLSLRFGFSAVKENTNLPDKLNYSEVDRIYNDLKNKYDGELDLQKLMLGLKKGLVEAAGDPYTVYMDSNEVKDFDEQLTGTFSGIGAELSKQDNSIVVIAPISGFPAERSGIKAGDIIAEIDDQDISGISVEEAVRRIRGEKGTSVKLTIIRDSQEVLEFSIVRDVISIASVETKKMDSIGYIKISRFAEDTHGLVLKAAKEFKAQADIKGIIVDLRNDPGGYLDAAVSVSEIWLSKNQIVLQEKRSDKVIETFKAEEKGILVGMPTVVLIDGGSASASEIMAGALKDNKAAQILGVTSFGKGSVQEFNRYSNGDVLKVTIARWYTPSGRNIDKEGIEPDLKIVLTENDVKLGEDKQLKAAIEAITR